MKQYFKKIWAWLTKAAAKIKVALGEGMLVANQIKQVADSKLLDAVVAATPTPLDDTALLAFRIALAKFITLMGWAEVVLDSLETADADAKAVVLTAINAKAAVLVAKAQGADLSIQEALASAPVIYDPRLLS